MKRYIYITLFMGPFSIHAQVNQNNYVITTTMLDSTETNVIMSAQYFDGLGRPVEQAEGGINPSGKGIYTYLSYDGNGRLDCSTLPIVGNNGCGYLSPITLSNLESGTYSDDITYSQTTYDPLNRPTFISTPGDAWQGHGKTIRYITNEANSVKRYHGNNSQPMFVDYYPAGALTGEVVMDEDSVTVTTFKDVAGRVVLERRGDGDDTYYVYKSNGLLRYILSPMYQESTSTNYRYRYDYDDKGRLTKKTLPGGQYVYYWYDSDNRLILERDSRLTSKSKNRFFLYDQLGRLAVQGTCTQVNSNCSSPVYVSRNAATGTEVCGTGYYVASIFTLSNPQIEIVNYYDDYSFLNATLWNSQTVSVLFNRPNPLRATSLQTGSITATSNGKYLLAVSYYDAEGRVIDTRENLLETGGLTTTTSYSFTGKPLTKQTTLTSGLQFFHISESFTYNSYDQLRYHDLTYGGDSTVRVASYSYNQLGRLSTLQQHNNRIGTLYTYDLHGWTKSIDVTKTYGQYSTLFRQDLYYADGSGTPCYNGNISSMKWKLETAGHGYKFSYDKRNRLTDASHTLYNMSILPYCYSETMTYNRNSAITSLIRTGNSQAGYGNMDFLSYSYTGNRLKSIYDMSSSNVYDGAFEFVDGANNTQEYWYNTAGDLTRDANKGIALINYDLLGHPTRVQFTNGNVTEYVYAADGRKLRTKQTTAIDGLTVPMGQTLELTAAQTMELDSTDYVDNMMITRSVIGSLISTPSVDYHFSDGYLSMTAKPYRPYPGAAIGVRYEPSFHYYIRDHLGSNRMVVGSDGSVEQKNQYYPYGGPWGDVSTNQGFQPDKYNAKELDRVHGLDWYDYGARMYDPAFCQFTQMDPLCEQYPHLSPYVYCAGNPVNAVDPDGMRPRRKEALAMADDVYNPSKKVLLGGWTWIDPESLNLTLPNDHGFKSAIYGRKTENGGFSEYVYATAGTDPTSIEDWKQDYKQLKGVSEQYRQSVETAVKVKSALGDQELTYLGHSLGGGLASANALKTGDPAITFNAAGLSVQTKQALQLNNKADITAYVVRNEFVNNSQALIGLRAEGRISYLPSAPLSLFPRVTRPALSIAYHTMAYLKLISTLLKDE